MPSGPKKRRAAKRKQQQIANAGSPSNADSPSYADSSSNAESPSNPNPTPAFKEVEGETEKGFSTLQSETPLRESGSGCFSIEEVNSHGHGQERLGDLKLEVNGDRDVDLDINESGWQEFCKEREASQDRKLNESAHVIVEESKLNEHIVSYDEKQGQVSQFLDENINAEECAEVNGNLNKAFQKEPPISFNENSGNMNLEIASENQDCLICTKTEKLENEDVLFEESIVNELVYVNVVESKISEHIVSCNDKQVHILPQLDEETCKKLDVEVNGNLDTTFQKKPPISFNEISDIVDLEIASENKDSLNCTKTNDTINAMKEKLEIENKSLKDSNEAIGVSPSNGKYKEAEISPFNVENNLRLDECSILVCDEEDIKESTVENSFKQTEEIPSIIDDSKSSVDINPVIQPRTDVNLHSAELHESAENNSKLVQCSACEDEILNRMASDNLDKTEEIHFVNENFNKPVDAVGEKPIADMLNIKLDQSSDQNARLDDDSALVPEEIKHSKNNNESLQSLIRAMEDSYLQSMEEPVGNSSNTTQTGNMQRDKVLDKELHKSTENNSKLVQSSACEDEGLNRIASDNLDKPEEIHFVNENFNKPVDAVGEKPIADMLNNKLDHSADQNARLDDNSASVPEATKHNENNYGSLESLIRATEDSYLQNMEESAENSSNTTQTGNMQRGKVLDKELHKSAKNDSKLLQSSASEEEGLNRIISDNLDKPEEIHFVNENFNKPVDAVRGKSIADMLNNNFDQSADQNKILYDNSAFVPEEIEHGKNKYGSLESLIRATEDSYLQSMEESVENSSNTTQTGNMQRDKADPKEPRQRSSFLKCCGLLEALTSSDR